MTFSYDLVPFAGAFCKCLCLSKVKANAKHGQQASNGEVK